MTLRGLTLKENKHAHGPFHSNPAPIFHKHETPRNAFSSCLICRELVSLSGGSDLNFSKGLRSQLPLPRSNMAVSFFILAKGRVPIEPGPQQAAPRLHQPGQSLAGHARLLGRGSPPRNPRTLPQEFILEAGGQVMGI